MELRVNIRRVTGWAQHHSVLKAGFRVRERPGLCSLFCPQC